MTASAPTLRHLHPRPGPDTVRRPQLCGVATALPPHRYEQHELLAALTEIWNEEHFNEQRLHRLFDAVQVGSRHLALPIEQYAEIDGLGAASEAFAEAGTRVAIDATQKALAAAGLDGQDLDAIFFTTVTGVATPSIDARLVNALSLRPDIKRTPMFGLGCVGGAAGVARMSDYLRAYPDAAAILVAVELCSLTLQREDLSIANFIASGLFGDGGAAVVGVGHRRRAGKGRGDNPRVLASESVFYPDTEWVMGWEMRDTGFKVVLSGELPELIETHVGGNVASFLAAHDLTVDDIDHWVCHPGGPAVMQALEGALDLPERALHHSREMLRDVGNLSSASVLHVLAAANRDANRGDLGLLMAMGPGFCAELVLLGW